MSKGVEAEADKIVKRLTDKKRQDAIESLELDGFRVTKRPPIERATAKLTTKPSGIVRLGIVSDTHIGSKYQQITALRDFYRYADSRGVTEYLHGGDMLEGLHVHRDAAYEQYALGVKEQVRSAAEQYPKSANGKTLFIDGNHDAWSYENAGVVSGELISYARPDLVYLGYYSAFVTLGRLRFLLQHGAKGGGAYGKSYKPQRLLETLADEERSQTDVALYGHWHSELYLGRYQGVFGFSLPCFKAQDRFLRTLGKTPTIGGIVLEIEFTRDFKVWNLRQDFRYYEAKLNDYPGAR